MTKMTKKALSEALGTGLESIFKGEVGSALSQIGTAAVGASGLRVRFLSQITSPYEVNAADLVPASGLDGLGFQYHSWPYADQAYYDFASRNYMNPYQPYRGLQGSYQNGAAAYADPILKWLKPAVEVEVPVLGIKQTYAPWGYPQHDLRLWAGGALVLFLGAIFAGGVFVGRMTKK